MPYEVMAKQRSLSKHSANPIPPPVGIVGLEGIYGTRTGNPPATGWINGGSFGISKEAEALNLQTSEWCDTSLQTNRLCGYTDLLVA